MTFLEIVLPLIGLAFVWALWVRRPGLVIDDAVTARVAEEMHRETESTLDLDVLEPDPFLETDIAWLAEHQIGGWSH